MMYYLISLFSVLILLSIIIIGNRINNRLLQISKSIDGCCLLYRSYLDNTALRKARTRLAAILFVHAGIGDIELCLRDPARTASNIAKLPELSRKP